MKTTVDTATVDTLLERHRIDRQDWEEVRAFVIDGKPRSNALVRRFQLHPNYAQFYREALAALSAPVLAQHRFPPPLPDEQLVTEHSWAMLQDRYEERVREFVAKILGVATTARRVARIVKQTFATIKDRATKDPWIDYQSKTYSTAYRLATA